MESFAFYRHVLALNIRSGFGRGFLMQMLFMILNNSIFWVTWVLFFGRFEHINGWKLPEVTLMYATCQLAWGIKIVLFGGTRNLARVISDGELDGYLLLPRSPLLYIASTRSFASGWGDMASGVVLVILSGMVTPAHAPYYLLGLACATTTFLASEVLLHSLAFWLGPTNMLSRQLTEFIIMLSCYPQNVYRGWLKVAMYVVVPAAVIGYLPVEFVKGSLPSGALMVLLTGLFSAAAALAFASGLRRYATG